MIQVTDLTLEDRELSSEHIREKHGRLDIRAKTSNGEIINVEIQTYADSAIGARELFYFAKLYTSQPAKGMQYYALKPVVIINLMSFNHFKDREQYHSCYEMQERDLHDVLSDKISVHFIKAPKCDKLSIKDKNRLIRWTKYLSYSSPEEIVEMAKDDDRIVFTGFVTGQTVTELYSNAYIFAIPSNLEGMANALLEAMSYGNCCLVSDIPENTEVVNDKAVWHRKSSEQDIYDKLQMLLDSPDEVARYKDEAAPYILERYSWDRVVDQMLEIYSGNIVEYEDVLKRHYQSQ